MPEYLNPNGYAVHLTGPDGQTVTVKAHRRRILPEYFERYVNRGFLKHSKATPAAAPTPAKSTQTIQAKIRVGEAPKPAAPATRAAPTVKSTSTRHEVARARKIAMATRTTKPVVTTNMRPQAATPRPQVATPRRQIVGRTLPRDANELLGNNLDKNFYPISNNIGVGVLSYNRSGSLRRLIDCITRHTDLRRTTVFVSDDASDDHHTVTFLDELATNPNFVVLRNDRRLGIAGNSNRLLRCLARFRYGLLLNDDVEVVAPGWEKFYPDAMDRSGMHHLIHRQVGVYGAVKGTPVTKGGVQLQKVDDKPHGAVLAFDSTYLEKVGYFDEAYGLYGMEHVDWSQRAWEMAGQDQGFFDVAESDSFFRVHAEVSAVQQRSELLGQARAVFAARQPRRVEPSPESAVPEISYVVPFRNFERTESIRTVVNNIRAQRFPVVHIIMVEQDSSSKLDIDSCQPVNHHLVTASNPLFNKAMAFNRGVASSPCDMVIMHDADMLAQGHYTKAVANVLKTHESCHLGSTVMYTVKEGMESVNRTGIVDKATRCDRIVGYYEGGSLAATKKGYWKCGGFNEDYWGYGCEDCDFYARLSHGSDWLEAREFDFLHLWHSRVGGWNGHHEANKALEGRLSRLPMERRISEQYQQLNNLGYDKELAEAMR